MRCRSIQNVSSNCARGSLKKRCAKVETSSQEKKHQYLLFVQVTNMTSVCFPQGILGASSILIIINSPKLNHNVNYSWSSERLKGVVSKPTVLRSALFVCSLYNPSITVEKLIYFTTWGHLACFGHRKMLGRFREWSWFVVNWQLHKGEGAFFVMFTIRIIRL